MFNTLYIFFLLSLSVPLFPMEIKSTPVDGDRVVPRYENSDTPDRLPGDNVLPHIDLQKSQVLQKVLQRTDIELSQTNESEREEDSGIVETHPVPKRVLPRKPKIANPEPSFSLQPPPPAPVFAKDTQIFHENTGFINKLEGVPSVSLPSNSTALATVVAGVKVRPGISMRLPIRLDYAFLGPNQAVVELTGCEAYITVNSDLNVSRLYGELGNISCRAPRGETFNIALRAHIVDQIDNYIGIEGTTILNGKMDAALLTFLSEGTNAFGKAMAAAQVTTQVQTTKDGEGVSGANVSGDADKYIAGQSIAGATSKFLNWWVDFYQNMQPTVEVASGRKIFLLTDGEVQVPKMFFANEMTRKNTATLTRKGEAQ